MGHASVTWIFKSQISLVYLLNQLRSQFFNKFASNKKSQILSQMKDGKTYVSYYCSLCWSTMIYWLIQSFFVFSGIRPSIIQLLQLPSRHWTSESSIWMCQNSKIPPFFFGITWIYPPPSNSGKWRFIGIPSKKCNNPGDYWHPGWGVDLRNHLVCK